MQWLLLAAAITSEPTLTETFPNRDEAITTLSREVQDGTLLFSQGDCLAVKCYTMSAYTHVAIVVKKDGKPFVYDSAKGSGVRCQSFADYMKYLRKDKLYIFQPGSKTVQKRSRDLTAWLDGKLGTPYSVKHHLTGNRAEGVHCSEFVTDALMSIELIHANRPARVSPASLAQGLTEGDLYDAVKTVLIDPPPTPKGDGTCSQLWIDTKVCSSNCWSKMKGWFCCN